MPTIATDGKGNYVTLDDGGNWVPTIAPDAQPKSQGDHGFALAPPEQPKPPAHWIATTQPTNEPTGGSEDIGLPVPRSPPPGGLVDTSITPGPNVATILPLSRDDAGNVRFALPNLARARLTEGPQIENGQLRTPAMINDPTTGRIGITPEALAAGTPFFGGGGLRFSGDAALMREPVSPFTLTKPLPVTTAEYNAALSRVPPAPVNQAMPGAPNGPAASAPPPAPPAAPPGVWVPMEPGMRYPGMQTRINSAGKPEVFDPTRGVPPEAPPSQPLPPPQPAPAATAPAPSPSPQPTTASLPDPPIMSQADIQARGRGYFNAADQAASKGAMLPDTNAAAIRKTFSDFVPADTETARIAASQPAMQAAKNVDAAGPMSYDTAMTIDRDLTSRMRGASGTDAHDLSTLQQALRDQMDQVPDLENLRPGRQAWKQSIKQGQMEDINAGAELKNDPAQADTYVRQRAAALLKNKNAMRYWDDEEKAQLTQVAQSGDIGMLGRLTTALIKPATRVALGAAGHAMAGPLGAIVGAEVGGDIGGTAAARVRSYLSPTDLTPVMRQITKGVPPPIGAAPQPPVNQLLGGPRVANTPGPVAPSVMWDLANQLAPYRGPAWGGYAGEAQRKYPPGYI